MTTPDADKQSQASAKSAAGPKPVLRKRRPAPEREGPIRASRGAGNGAAKPDPGAGKSANGTAGPTEAAAPPVAAAPASEAPGSIAATVQAAYQVVERNIQEGRAAAERLRAAGAPLADTPSSKVAANRLLHMTRDLGAAWADMVTAFVRESDLRGLLERVSGHDREAAPAATASPPSVTVVQRISSRQPVEVMLSPLADSAAVPPPGLAGLYSLDAKAPPITAVRFAVRAGGGLELHIDVPDGQPPGTYAGAVVDVASQQPLGTLSIKVFG
jgi:hypothetical protein